MATLEYTDKQGRLYIWAVWFFRWWRHWQIDIALGRRRWFSIGVNWRPRFKDEWAWPRLIAYYSPDATPVHPKARGLGARRD